MRRQLAAHLFALLAARVLRRLVAAFSGRVQQRSG